ncbi:trehalose operon repressor [Sutcliffiella rhizosphaerae]|uniref:Trehalose operon repressor n=1 Tax=Sutcliffiella rhizosphaerae TaxID=2880967 RepID=A0ABN8A7L0_9BACI|nr:trehalose operon repressor [Sutcliffiella rhizosphaerae]CAG9619922.1 HTH-type transcriptional regulator TreR [Sutcliffiella rhizosphaerae]
MKNNKYQLIYQKLVQKIDSHVFSPGEKLPSEHELVEMFHTSRETVRKALNQLAQNGYIQKVRGKGSIVLDRGKFDFPISGLISFKELAEKMGRPWETIVHEVTEVAATKELSSKLGELELWKVVRSRKVDNDNIILDQDYFIKSKVPYLDEEICRNSIYDYLESGLSLQIAFADKEVTVEEATDLDKELLDLQGLSHVVVVKSIVHLDDASPFQYTESRHRLDKFRFVDFARRMK